MAMSHKITHRRKGIPLLVGTLILILTGGIACQQPKKQPATVATSTLAPPVSSTASAQGNPFIPPTPTPVFSTDAGVVLPNRRLTPGSVFAAMGTQQICVPGYAESVRNVAEGTRRAVFSSYRIDYALHGNYELDHLVPLELGGDNSAQNLWPEPRSGPEAAGVKDHLENHLHDLVCAGQVSLAEAQQAMQGDWWTANSKYSQLPVVARPTEPVATRYSPPAQTYTSPAAPGSKPPASSGNVVHPGAFCSPEGATGQSSTGKSEVCGPASDGRNRWHQP